MGLSISQIPTPDRREMGTTVAYQAGDFDAVEWVSNWGQGPETACTGLFRVSTANGKPHSAYRVALGFGFTADRDRTGSISTATEDILHTPGVDVDAVEARVAAVLHHGYPAQSLSQLAQLIGEKFVSEAEAAAATQSALWYFTDGFRLLGSVKSRDCSRARIAAIYEHLIGVAKRVPAEATAELLVVDFAESGSLERDRALWLAAS